MPQKTKPPVTVRRVYSDDLAVAQDEQTYYPHAGEWVEFKGRPTLGLYLKLTQLGTNPEALALMAAQIDGWSWTDDNGEPYANPPTVETLLMLPSEEIGWLIQHAGSPATRTEEQQKNGSSPSTAS